MARVPVLPQHRPQFHVVEIALVEHLAAQCPFVAHTAFFHHAPAGRVVALVHRLDAVEAQNGEAFAQHSSTTLSASL